MSKVDKDAITHDNEALPGEIRLGYWLLGGFILALVLWGAFIPLAAGVIAPAVVGVEGDNKLVQHLNGGLIQEVMVKEGDLVKQGSTLLTLDTQSLQQRLDELRSQYILLLARHARLEAESQEAKTIHYADWLTNRKNEADVTETMNNQQRIFQSELNLLQDKEAAYQYRINQAHNQIRSDQNRLQSANSQIHSINAELHRYQQLLSQGLVTRNQSYSLENTQRSIVDRQATLQLSIDSSRSLIEQYQAELSEFKMSRKNEAAKALDPLQSQLASVEKELALTRESIRLSNIRAPISGYIVNLRINTVGGVITPGQPLMEIIPNDTKYVLKATVQPKDRISVSKGQSAEVRFSAFNQRSTPTIQAEVTLVSADRLINANTQAPYYGVNIELTEDPEIKLQGQRIYPGMQAEVIISTGKRTTLDYLISPLTQSFNRALREN